MPATQSGSQISDDLKVGIVLANLDDGLVREHLMLNAERLTTWLSFKMELEQITRLRSYSQGGLVAMDVDALTKNGGRKGPKGGKGNETRVCWKCGKPGHLAKDCKAGGKGVGGTRAPLGGGKGAGKGI